MGRFLPSNGSGLLGRRGGGGEGSCSFFNYHYSVLFKYLWAELFKAGLR